MSKPASAEPSSASHISRRQFLTYGAGTAALLSLPSAVAMNMSGMNMVGIHSKSSPLPKPVFSGALTPSAGICGSHGARKGSGISLAHGRWSFRFE
ncbi:twin-arginine translocation signal domain-containing protein [Acidithiobacillus thiooxidans]|uniref:twin-arginine translocation signal domain-containing protein n=1 Tax=Acidithiobacillus thiooxidans TaxID=930 RepID=UPI001930B30D|nr:twin-arginine translocation signal domain-containing protein [Acidithiobacillus thiooxidans]